MQTRLREVLWSLAEPILTVRRVGRPATIESTASLDRVIAQLARAVSQEPSSFATLTASGRQILEVQQHENGSVQPLMVESGVGSTV